MSDTPKKTFGKYEAISHLGSGAMGVVWRAQDPILGRTVAIKTISATMGVDNDSKERFLREARAAAQLNHPNIITVYDFGQAGDELYMAMELLEGKDLKELITAGNLTLDQKLNIMEQVSDGMAYAHGRDVVHRDLKPGNIHVQPSGQVKILDFGLARLGSSELTKTGVVMGTPNYMSPEQVMGERADSRSDVFSAGAVFYELLTNRKPFDADSVHATLYQVVHREPPPPRQWDATLPEGLVSIIEIAMTKQMAGRQKDGRALHDAIRAFRYGEEPEVVEEYEEPSSAAASPAAPSTDPISSDATSFSPGAASASSSSVSKSAPAPFRSYGRTGSAAASSTNLGAGQSSIGRAPRTDSKPPASQSGPVDLPAASASAISPPPAAPAKNLMPMIAAGVGVLVLAGLIGAWVMNRKTEDKAPSNLDALAANLVESQLGMARRALGDKDYKGALEQADRVLKLEVANPEAMGIKEQAQSAIAEIETWVGVARAAVARGASAQATAALERVMSRDPRNPIVAELSSQLNASFSARAADARTEMEKARAQAEGQDGAAGEAAFAEAEELAAAADKSFEAGEFTTATQTFVQARDAYDRARRAVTSGSRPSGGSSAPRVPIASTAAPTAPAVSAAESLPSAGAGAGSAPASAPAAAAGGVSAGEAREFQTSPTSVDGVTPAEFEGRVEFEVQPTPLRVGTPFRVRIFLRNEGKKDSKLDRLSVKIARNGEPSSPEAKIVKDDVKMGQRTLVATIPAQDSGKSLFLPPGTTAWSLDVEGTSRKGERIRSTLTMKQP